MFLRAGASASVRGTSEVTAGASPSSPSERLVAWAATRSRHFWTIAALLLVAPTLLGGWVADDYIQLLSQRPQPGVPGIAHRPLDLFRFADGTASTARALMEQGVFPWWADPRVRLAFLRPLASLTQALDAQLWPGSSVAMHAHSLLWYLGLVLGAGAAYRRFSSSAITAMLALALFAVDDAHAPVVGWIANRNSLVALAIMLMALLLHDQWRRGGAKSAALAAHAGFALGLSGGEAATALIPYFCGYALCLDHGKTQKKLGSLLGYVAIFVAWRIVYGRLGYGVSGSGLYFDPASAPLGFLWHAPARLLALLQGLFGAPWSEFWEVYPLASPLLQPAIGALGLLLLSALLVLAWPALEARPAARFWLCGAIGAILPACASFPHDRLLLGASIGSAAFLAEVLDHTVSSPQRWRRFGAGSVLTLHLVCAPVLCVLRASTVGKLDALLRQQQETLPLSTAVRSQTVVLINPPLDPLAAYLAPYRELHGIPRPEALYWLATGVSELRLTTRDAHTLTVRPRGGYLWSSSQRMLRDPSTSRRYEPVHLRQATFEVTELTSDGRPAEVRVRFERRLDDPELRFFRWQEHGYAEVHPPAIGDSVIVPAVDCLAALRG